MKLKLIVLSAYLTIVTNGTQAERFDKVYYSKSPTGLNTNQISQKDNSSIVDLDPNLKKITKATYEHAWSYIPFKKNGFIKGSGLSIESNCDEICVTYLVEDKTGKKMLLPADFDSGLIGLIVSKSRKQFITYSSYDSPDYNEFYAYRALITKYQMGRGVGLKTIKEKQTYGFKNWSIAEVKWINDSSLALKVYGGSSAYKIHYSYFKVEI